MLLPKALGDRTHSRTDSIVAPSLLGPSVTALRESVRTDSNPALARSAMSGTAVHELHALQSVGTPREYRSISHWNLAQLTCIGNIDMIVGDAAAATLLE